MYLYTLYIYIHCEFLIIITILCVYMLESWRRCVLIEVGYLACLASFTILYHRQKSRFLNVDAMWPHMHTFDGESLYIHMSVCVFFFDETHVRVLYYILG